MAFEEIFAYIVLALTSSLLFLLAVQVLGMESRVLVASTKELVDCVGASMIFFVVNIALGASVILVLRALGQFVPLYVMTNWGLLLFSLGQGFVFQMWWRRSKTQLSNRKSATSGK